MQGRVGDEQKCWVCLRITPAFVLRAAHQIWPPETAREIGLAASDIIRRSYEKNPFFLCGKKTRIVVASLFYLLGMARGAPKTQREIAMALGVKEVSVSGYQRWLEAFPEFFPQLKDYKTIRAYVRHQRPRRNIWTRAQERWRCVMGMGFSKLIRKETLKVLDEWLKEREGAIVGLNAEIKGIVP